MSSQSDKNTKEELNSEIKDLRQRCIHSCRRIENAPIPSASPDVVKEALSYVGALGSQVRSSKVAISTDENLIITQFLAELKKNSEEVEKHTAFTRAAIKDVENEIQRLKSLTTIAEEAMAQKPPSDTNKEFQERMNRAKEEFRLLRTELNKLIQSIFKDRSDAVTQICGELMQKQLKEESNKYIQVTEENALIIEVLKDINIVSENPYNRMEVRLNN